MLARFAQAWLLPPPPPRLLLPLLLLLHFSLFLPAPASLAQDLLPPLLQRPWLRSVAPTRLLTWLRGCRRSSAT